MCRILRLLMNASDLIQRFIAILQLKDIRNFLHKSDNLHCHRHRKGIQIKQKRKKTGPIHLIVLDSI